MRAVTCSKGPKLLEEIWTSYFEKNAGTKSFLRWAGSKKQLLPLLSRFARYRYDRYVEPFAGSACLFFSLAPKRAILSDINEELMLTFQEVKKDSKQVSERLGGFYHGRDEYLRIRGLDPIHLAPAVRAARFIYLNRFSFNGLYRTNRAGRFNVPYGGGRTGRLPSLELLEVCGRTLQSVELLTCDFQETLDRVKRGDLVYLDPPFSISARRTFTDYSRAGFGTVDVERLRRSLEAMASQDVTFVVSYAKSPEADQLADGFHRYLLRVRRSIAGAPTRRRVLEEYLISNKPMP